MKINTARVQDGLNYADREINAIFLRGPFAVPLALSGGGIPVELNEWACCISYAWLVLSNGTVRNEVTPAKMVRERCKVYVAAGLCKALLRYPADLIRTTSRQRFVVTQNTAPADDSVEDRLRRQLFDASYTENPSFRKRFDEYVSELVAIKKKHDPRDTSRDYRLGPQDYLQAANGVIEKYWPGCIECTAPASEQTLALRDRIRSIQLRIYSRMTGHMPTPDWAAVSIEDYRSLYNCILDICDTARQYKIQPSPVPPRGSTFDALHEYLVSLEQSIEGVTVQNDDPKSPALISQAEQCRMLGLKPNGTEYGKIKRLRKKHQIEEFDKGAVSLERWRAVVEIEGPKEKLKTPPATQTKASALPSSQKWECANCLNEVDSDRMPKQCSKCGRSGFTRIRAKIRADEQK